MNRKTDNFKSDMPGFAESILETVRESLIILDSNLRIISANKSFYQTYIVKPEETEGQLIYDIGNGQWDIPRLRELLEKILPQHNTFNDFEMEHDFETIGKRTMLLNARQIYQESNKIQMILLAIEDITEFTLSNQKLIDIEVELKRNDAKLRLLFESSYELISLTDVSATVLWANPAWEKVFGALGSEREDPFTLIHPEDIERVAKAWELMLNTDEPIENIQYRFKGPDGKYIHFETCVYIVASGNEKQYYTVAQNITERKKTKIELKSSQERFNLAMQSSRDGLFDWNLITNEIYYSPQWKRMLGYEDDELPNDFSVWEKLTRPDDIKKSWDMQKRLIAKELDRFELEFQMQHKQGHWVDVLSRAQAFFDEDGKAIRIVGTHVDITESKQAEEALMDQKNFYESIFNATIDTIYIFNPTTGEPLYWNQANTKILGYTQKEMKARLAASDSFYKPEDLVRVGAAVQECLENKSSYLQADAKTKNGTWIPFEYNLSLLENGSQGPNICVVGRDVTERKLAANKLSHSEQLNNAITETAADAIISINNSGLITTWNRGATRMFGYGPEKMIGSSLEKIVPSEHISDHSKGVGRLAVGGKEKLIGKQIEIEAIRKDGTRFPIELGLSSWQVGEERNFTAIIRDITERVASASSVSDALEEARHANSVKDEFIANISHEIRTPLNSIIGFSDLFFQRYGEQVLPRDQEIFGYISKASNRLMHTVDSILNISLLKAGTLVLQPQAVDLNILVSRVINELIANANEKGLILNAFMADKTAMVHVDEYCIYKSIFNLTDNAIKFTYEGLIQLEVAQINGNITLLISDTGIGMSEEYQGKIFTPYTQESEGFTKTYQGIGLGLAITKQYLDLNQVDLKIVSQSGVGSTFSLAFPPII